MAQFSYPQASKQQGFTLLELAVVLVIIATLAAAVTVGEGMLSRSKLRDIVVRANEYASIIQQFQQKYSAFPGDMTNATAIWGRADGGAPVTSNCAAPATNVSTTAARATCNGNGDGTIARTAATYYELFRAWQHLKNADMVAGNFTGAQGALGNQHVVSDSNAPPGYIKNSAYDIVYLEDGAIPASYFSGPRYQHVIHFGLEQSTNNFARLPVISAADMYTLDQKLDDGKPASGVLLTFTNTAQNTCASTDVAATADYFRQNNSGMNCALIFITGF